VTPVRLIVQLSALVVVLLQCGSVEAATAFSYIDSLRVPLGAHTVVLDTRQAGRCETRSVAGARCLPPSALLGPHGRLPAFRQLVWVLGAAGLSGRGTVVVAGDDPESRDFVAGVLFLLGQAQVQVLRPRLTGLLNAHRLPVGTGAGSAMVAQPLFQGQARSRLIVFRGELLRALRSGDPPVLLDGRSDARYWGKVVTARRGGHIPGARSLPVDALQLQGQSSPQAVDVPPDAIVYAQTPESSIAYFTRLTAGLGVHVRVFARGWRDWADHTAMPVDAETLPSSATAAPAPRGGAQNGSSASASLFAVSITSLLFAIAAVAIAMRRKEWI